MIDSRHERAVRRAVSREELNDVGCPSTGRPEFDADCPSSAFARIVRACINPRTLRELGHELIKRLLARGDDFEGCVAPQGV
jgi:hypothetical protein